MKHVISIFLLVAFVVSLQAQSSQGQSPQAQNGEDAERVGTAPTSANSIVPLPAIRREGASDPRAREVGDLDPSRAGDGGERRLARGVAQAVAGPPAGCHPARPVAGSGYTAPQYLRLPAPFFP